ncbi:murein L,D-transpeptidase [Pseudorhodobacter sp.]|uniref:L,D-transpeptidase family protein n=1 Tax=Pseudorhodobacter sp. TaxID=1934400 RepID=UPI0026495D77|nr:L,D-transpeptidase family protein [Pseudorhodobacter sp.]MDN5786318.1 L,D-transpeptidase family protein [Pseudorhodobacter sp.]
MSLMLSGAGIAPVAAQTNISFAVAKEIDAFSKSVASAVAAADDKEIAEYYRDTDYAPIWTGEGQEGRRSALLSALAGAGAHGLPVRRYDPAALIAASHAVRTEGDRGRLDVMMTEALLDYAHDVQTGALTPGKVIPLIKREVPLRDRRANIEAFVRGEPVAFLKSLPPKTQAYAQLMRAKFELEQLVANGGWGPKVDAKSLKPGNTGPTVLQLRDRLIALNYMPRSVTASYDASMQKAVQSFQVDMGLTPDGVAGASTILAINTDPQTRLEAVVVAMERERWMNIPRGKRHIWVNLTDFTAKIVDHGRVTFSTRSVIGADSADRQTPEFSDEMEYMVVNPSWNVPRSITTKEYLPMMQRNPNAAGHLKIIDSRGRVVPRSAINFAGYTARNFPYAMRQAPSDGNALGLVKFMFPNPYNIYLHDTPSKSLFQREVRAFSHGCIRLGDPFDFAYALLAMQTDDPVGLFKSYLKTGRETNVKLEHPVPVHLVYFTAYPSPKGRIEYRNDVYGRDATIFRALTAAGVVLGPHQG